MAGERPSEDLIPNDQIPIRAPVSAEHAGILTLEALRVMAELRVRRFHLDLADAETTACVIDVREGMLEPGEERLATRKEQAEAIERANARLAAHGIPGFPTKPKDMIPAISELQLCYPDKSFIDELVNPSEAHPLECMVNDYAERVIFPAVPLPAPGDDPRAMTASLSVIDHRMLWSCTYLREKQPLSTKNGRVDVDIRRLFRRKKMPWEPEPGPKEIEILRAENARNSMPSPNQKAYRL